MTTIRCTGTSAEAARVLIEGSALSYVLADWGRIHYDLPRMAEVTLAERYIAMLSTGERLLWDALRALSGPDAGVDVWSCADRLDEPSRGALADAVGIALGARLAPTPVREPTP